MDCMFRKSIAGLLRQKRPFRKAWKEGVSFGLGARWLQGRSAEELFERLLALLKQVGAYIGE